MKPKKNWKKRKMKKSNHTKFAMRHYIHSHTHNWNRIENFLSCILIYILLFKSLLELEV